MEIVLSPDPRLLEKCEPIHNIDKSIKRLAKQMQKMMYKNNGVGLAAPQVGVNKQMIVVDTEYDGRSNRNCLTLINPEVVWESDEKAVGPEGCLSIPGVSFDIERAKAVKVRALDLDGNEVEYEADGNLFSVCLQHEIDHLNGITMFERIPPMRRMQALREYQEALDKGAKPGDTGV